MRVIAFSYIMFAAVVWCLFTSGLAIGYLYEYDFNSPKTCFTPYEDCRSVIVSEINKAQNDIKVQAYYFTCPQITQALFNARMRGVSVSLIADKSQASHRQTRIALLKAAGASVMIDKEHSIHHNKIIIIDSERVITGSYNFSRNANERNSENIIIIDNRHVAFRYLDNFEKCKKHSFYY